MPGASAAKSRSAFQTLVETLEYRAGRARKLCNKVQVDEAAASKCVSDSWKHDVNTRHLDKAAGQPRRELWHRQYFATERAVTGGRCALRAIRQRTFNYQRLSHCSPCGRLAAAYDLEMHGTCLKEIRLNPGEKVQAFLGDCFPGKTGLHDPHIEFVAIVLPARL